MKFHPQAEAELQAAALWYDERQSGLGEAFLEEVEFRVKMAARFPKSGSPALSFELHHDVRRYVFKQFRYVMITACIQGETMVVAIAHTSRDPTY